LRWRGNCGQLRVACLKVGGVDGVVGEGKVEERVAESKCCLSFFKRRHRRGPEGSGATVARRQWVRNVGGFAVASQLISDQSVDEGVPEEIVIESGRMRGVCRTPSRELGRVFGG
jgi:hypothetical protein